MGGRTPASRPDLCRLASNVLISNSTAGPVGQPSHPFHRRDACPAAPSRRCRRWIMPKKKKTAPAAAKPASSGTQQVRAGDKTVMENVATSETDAKDSNAVMQNVATPKAEAKDHVGDNHLALWNALEENRWSRKRKLLPNLRLTYPSDSESRHIAALARVSNPSSFGK